ncbi:hypothetical protein Y032_0233g3098 [Ancylostoma ceylanicum]|uniref:Uncharacterized protein n=1 Tax=Ancylostoma ceylanicum TaxID=53326 RepID=A0A016SFC5_9BILA|nr:hypothetical protein Y032_0233g3098 [Ancylostoma ceylanicum]
MIVFVACVLLLCSIVDARPEGSAPAPPGGTIPAGAQNTGTSGWGTHGEGGQHPPPCPASGTSGQSPPAPPG